MLSTPFELWIPTRVEAAAMQKATAAERIKRGVARAVYEEDAEECRRKARDWWIEWLWFVHKPLDSYMLVIQINFIVCNNSSSAPTRRPHQLGLGVPVEL